MSARKPLEPAPHESKEQRPKLDVAEVAGAREPARDEVKGASFLPFAPEAIDAAVKKHRASLSVDNLDYTGRQTRPAEDDELAALKARVLLDISRRIKTILPVFNLEAIDEAKDEVIKSMAEPLQSLVGYYKKVKGLAVVDIPQKDGKIEKYCRLVESVGGVTEKVTLVRLDAAKEKLRLASEAGAAVSNEEFLTRLKLRPEGIIKLPKHSVILEVQRVAIALNISRILGLDTTESTMVHYIHGEAKAPALFVPFGNIKLLNEFTHGKIEAAILGGKELIAYLSSIVSSGEAKTYTNYSTIKPVGEGLQPDQCIECFGKALAFFYLCNDPDAIGGYNQNKALTLSRSLYIFDQVLMPTKRFNLNSGMSLSPVGIKGRTRHGEGRNKTLIEDSSIEEKFDSLVHLAKNADNILAMLDDIIKAHQAAIRAIPKDEKTSLPTTEAGKQELRNLEALLVDAVATRGCVAERISHLFDNFPTLNGVPISIATLDDANINIIKKSSMLEKFLNKPRLFTVDGRPYKHPYTESHSIKITDVSIKEGIVTIGLNSPVSEEYLSMLLPKAGINSTTLRADSKSIKMSVTDYMKIQEAAFLPECAPLFNPSARYLRVGELKLLGEAYGEGHRTRAISAITRYKTEIEKAGISPSKMISLINATLREIKGFTSDPADKGFVMHILKKLYLDIHQKLQSFIPAHLKALTMSALNAAIKLDQIGMFTDAVITAIAGNVVSGPEFAAYLQKCVQHAEASTNYDLSKHHSAALACDSRQFMHTQYIARRDSVLAGHSSRLSSALPSVRLSDAEASARLSVSAAALPGSGLISSAPRATGTDSRTLDAAAVPGREGPKRET